MGGILMKKKLENFMAEFELWKVQTKMKWFVYLFPQQSEQMVQLIKDNHELQGIAVEQINHIQELEDKIASLEYREEDLELDIERLEDEVRDLENDNDNLQYEVSDLEDQVRGYEWEVETLEDRINELEQQIIDNEEDW
jgi:predicted  nucleic acid-binding Zn-ribbon protein